MKTMTSIDPSGPPNRARILAAAGKRFSRFGYRRTGVADIARQAGVAAGTLYRYFKDKEEIFREVVRLQHALWLERMHRVLAEPGTGGERLARLGQASAEFDRENSLLNSVLRRDEEFVYAPLIEELHDKLVRANVEMLAEVLRAGARDGTLRPVDPERAAYVLFLAGEALMNPQNQRYYTYAETLPVHTEIIGMGLAPRGS
jgi:AcrR family transcriptional regulator